MSNARWKCKDCGELFPFTETKWKEFDNESNFLCSDCLKERQRETLETLIQLSKEDYK